MEYQEILTKALELWGPQAQTFMVMEEMAELQKELCKEMRGYDKTAAVAEEIADVQIMLDQMVILHNCAGQVEAWKQHKLARLQHRVETELEARQKEGKHEDT